MLQKILSLSLALLIATLINPNQTHAAGEVAPDEMTGLKVGEKVPDFKLTDQNGQEISLQDLLDIEGTTVLVFHRSANW